MRILVESLSKSIQGKAVLRHVSLTVQEGQSLALIGPNGSGKSTLLRAIAGLVTPDQGSVSIGPDKLSDISPRSLAQRLGFVTQDAGTTDAISVREAVKLGRTPWLSFVRPFGAKDAQIVDAAMHQMAIHSYQDKLFNTLSGGEKQRVHIARALAQTPQVFLLDEPTNHLDIRHQIAIIDWVKHQSATVVLALHDLNHAFACDRVAVMNEGSMVAFGAPSDVLVPEVLSPVFKVAVRKGSLPHEDQPVLSFAREEI